MAKLLYATLKTGIVLAAGFHICVLWLVNCPPNPIKRTFSPEFAWYAHPYLSQGWALFAPRPPATAVDVWARGESAGHELTEWIDVSRELGVTRLPMHSRNAVAEALFHAARSVRSDPEENDRSHLSIVMRTSAMVLRAHFPDMQLVRAQVMLRRMNFLEASRPRSVVALGWFDIPRLTELR